MALSWNKIKDRGEALPPVLVKAHNALDKAVEKFTAGLFVKEGKRK
jgi:DNA-binding NtrC family response regulator